MAPAHPCIHMQDSLTTWSLAAWHYRSSQRACWRSQWLRQRACHAWTHLARCSGVGNIALASSSQAMHAGRSLILYCCRCLQCDPFCNLWVRESHKLRTTVKSRTLKPVWKESFTFMVHSTQHQELTMALYDSGAAVLETERVQVLPSTAQTRACTAATRWLVLNQRWSTLCCLPRSLNCRLLERGRSHRPRVAAAHCARPYARCRE